MYATDPASTVKEHDLDRFVDRIILRPDGCWDWGGNITTGGYGRFATADGKTVAAHRYVWLWLRGRIDEEKVIDHLCRNRACCNPEHLEPVTQRENLRRGLQFALKTHCKHGHLYVPIKHGNNLWCRECKKTHDHKMWLRRKERMRLARAKGAAPA